ncbi:hypothetical protein EUGRSUZ_H00735 [Eucalyptus grandis]|uniref:Uncharacterized protein n=2 Tax=Eucalyptus grandis TaxID=71139 RepID=A0A059AX51_EUCGR|nr:hypothetical protein EUGRSUZ_H00735 [Eucalyptus grandis]
MDRKYTKTSTIRMGGTVLQGQSDQSKSFRLVPKRTIEPNLILPGDVHASSKLLLSCRVYNPPLKSKVQIIPSILQLILG